MKRRLFLLAILIGISAIGFGQHNQLDEKIKEFVSPLVETNNYSGTILVTQKGKVIFSDAFGKMSLEYNLDHQIDSKFFLASASMMFTAAGIMKLVDQGKISLEDKVSKFFPAYKHGEKMTIHHLLAQRSGIPGIGAEGNVSYDSITKFTHSTEQLYAYFKDYDLLFEPGEKYNHGRSEYILLAYIIEKITGKSFGEFLEEEIFVPLDMMDTGHCAGEHTIISNLSTGYAAKDLYDLDVAYRIDWSAKTGHASIYSTVGDLHKFATAVLNQQLLNQSSWDKILHNYGQDVGYGWFIRDHLDRRRFQMNGRSPGFSSYFAIYPDEELVIVVLSNNYISLPYDIGQNIAAMLLGAPVETLNLTTEAISKQQIKDLVGHYQFGADFYRPNFKLGISDQGGRLYCDWGALVPVDKGKGAFNKFILRAYWSNIVFVRNEKGVIDKMTFDGFEGRKLLGGDVE